MLLSSPQTATLTKLPTQHLRMQESTPSDYKCLGVFTWEPQSYGNWKGYGKGMFDDSGKPTDSFNAFKR